MKRLLLSTVLTIALSLTATAADEGWISLFNGKDPDGWKANGPQGTFKVEDGQIIVHGPRSHLFYTEPDDVKRPPGMAGRLIGQGTFCIQGRDPKSEVRYKSIMVKPMP